MRELAALKSDLAAWREMEQRSSGLVGILELAIAESDDSISVQCEEELGALTRKLDELEFALQFSGEHDGRPALLAIKQGAGGVEAQDWADMLLRMYCRWAERRGFIYEVLDHTPNVVIPLG